MKTSKPQAGSTVRVTASDADTGKSKSMTLYDCTPEEVIDALTYLADASSPRRRRRVGS